MVGPFSCTIHMDWISFGGLRFCINQQCRKLLNSYYQPMFNALFISTLTGMALATPSLGQDLSLKVFQRSSLLSSGCPANGPVSCQSDVGSNTCCVESPGGLLLQTQFWDTNPSTGPDDSWTIHGLWPDNCNGTFNENCDPSRDYTDIGDLLANNGASDTLDFMNQFWVDINGQNEKFWEHEWATHGTCMSTLDPQCLPSGSIRGAEAVAFFQTVVKLFQTLPTYTFLANAGITPSSSQTYTLSKFISALQAGSGVRPQLGCSGSKVNSISWYFNLQGSVIDGIFIPIDAPQASTCHLKRLEYLPKSQTLS